MRTTLDIDDDVLQAAKEIARREGKTAGRVVSEMLRRALTTPATVPPAEEPVPVYGLRPFPARGVVVTSEAIDRLRDESG